MYLIVPITKFEMKGLTELQVGNVSFFSAIDTITNEPAKLAIEKESFDDPASLFSHSKNEFLGKAIAIAEVDAQKEFVALELAQKEIEQSINVLRFYLSGLERHDVFSYRFHMGIQGTGLSSYMSAIAVSKNGKPSYVGSRTGFLYGYSLDEDKLAKMRELHFDIIHKILLQPESKHRTFAKNVLTSINYFGYAMNEIEKKDAFVDFMISLESLLLNPKCQRGALSERIAYILATDSKQRRSLIERVNELYKKRSGIVHEGRDEITKADLQNIFKLAWPLIIKLIPLIKRINDKSRLIEMITDLKYSGPPFQIP